MARRKLEAALQAGRNIANGKGQIYVDHDIQMENEVDGIYSLQFSFDGSLLAVGCGNGTIRLYDSATGRKVTDIRKTRYNSFPNMALRFHPKNPGILYAGTSEGKVFSCDVSEFINDRDKAMSSQQQQSTAEEEERFTEIIQESKSLKEKRGKVNNEINCLDFDYTGFRFATAGKDLSIRIYDASTNELIREYTGYDVTKDPTDWSATGQAMRVFALKWHPMYDDVFVTGGWENQLKIWDSRSNDGIKRTIHGPKICGDSLDLKDYKILTGSHRGVHALELWDYNDDKNKPKDINFPCGKDGAFLYCAQFGDNDLVLAGGSGTNSAQAINTATGESLGEVKFNMPIHALDSTFGGSLFAVGDRSAHLKICSIK